MADTQITLELLHRIVGENIIDHTHTLVNVEVLGAFALTGNDTGRFLTPMLQGYQPQADNLRDVDLCGPFTGRDRPEHAALVCQTGLNDSTAKSFAGQFVLFLGAIISTAVCYAGNTWHREGVGIEHLIDGGLIGRRSLLVGCSVVYVLLIDSSCRSRCRRHRSH